MKTLKNLVLVSLFILLFGSAAGAQEYIFRYKEDAVMPLSADFEHEHIARSFYSSDDETELQRLFEAGVIEYYVPDAEVWLMDDASDPQFINKQKDYEFKWTNAVGVVNNGRYDGRGVRVGIIDTGLAGGHEDIDYTKVVATRDITVEKETDNGAFDVTDYQGHGTAVAGVIAAKTNNNIGVSSLAPGVELVIVKAFAGSSKSTSVKYLISGLDYAAAQGCDVINMSVGTEGYDNPNTAIRVMREMIDEISAEGVIVIAAAGNHNTEADQARYKDIESPLMYPGAFENVISVAAINNDGDYTVFSYHNKMVDIAACGESVTVLNWSNTTGTFPQSGTSFSSPYVASVAALVKQIDPDIDVNGFRELLAETAIDAGDPGWDIHYGYGIVNVGKIMDRLLGPDIEVGSITPDGRYKFTSQIVNNGFDRYELMDIWCVEDEDGTQYNTRVETTVVEPRSSVKSESYRGMLTVKHMVWSREDLEPLCPAEEHETGF